MVRIMGNSIERVPIKDLNDVIYYRQIKQYSDAEYSMSKDLKREKSKGTVVVLEQNEGLRGSEVDFLRERVASSTINAQDLKKALQELLPQKVPEQDMKGAVMELAPLIINVIRQELSKIGAPRTIASKTLESVFEFQDPTYVPTISTEGMKSSIEAKKTEVSSAGTVDALAALRRLQK